MRLIFSLLMIFGATTAFSQEGINYDESKVPTYTLPALLKTESGKSVKNVKDWETERRPELLQIFATQMYGVTPDEKIPVSYQVMEETENAFNGKATRKQVKFTFSNNGKQLEAMLLMFIPNKVQGKIPVIVGYNYKGNHSTIADSSILYSPSLHLVKEPGHPDWVRGCQSNRWAFEDMINRGYAVATMCYHDIFQDKKGLKQHSIVSLFSDFDENSQKSDEWQAIGAWAWGSSRILDYLATLSNIDVSKSLLMGHSRQGKAALWAGAQDERFGIVIANNSGSGGAALSKREYGETVDRVSSITPAWFCPAFRKYAKNEKNLPFDQHQLIALMAPRPVYVASAVEDRWADPKGEFLSTYHAGPAYKLYGLKTIKSDKMPALHQPVMTHLGYHIREGIHDVTDYDWSRFMDFADLHFKKKK